MKRFKLIFHIVYVLITLVIMYFSIDILMNTEAYLSKVKLSSYIKFPRYVMGIFLFLSILMIIEFVIHQLSIYQGRGNVEEMEKEILQLKAKLYDRGQVDAPSDDQMEELEESESVSEEESEDEG